MPVSSATSSCYLRVNVLCPSCYLLLLLQRRSCYFYCSGAHVHKLIRSSSLHPNDLRREGIMWSDERCKCARVCVCVWKTKDENETRKMKTKDERRKTKDENENRRRKPTNTPPNRQLVTADYAELSNSLLY